MLAKFTCTWCGPADITADASGVYTIHHDLSCLIRANWRALWHIEEDALEAIEASGVAVGDYGEVVRHEFGGLVNQGHTIEFGAGDDAQDVL
jgi:hypothetical protein